MKPKSKFSWKIGGATKRPWLSRSPDEDESFTVATSPIETSADEPEEVLAPPYSEEESAIISEPLFAAGAPIGIEELSERLRSVSEPAPPVTELPVDAPVAQTIVQLADQTETHRPVEARIERPAEHPAARRPIFQPINRPLERPFTATAGSSQPTSRPFNQPAAQTRPQPAASSEWQAPRPPSTFRAMSGFRPGLNRLGQAPAAREPNNPSQRPATKPTGMARAVNAIKIALPVVQRLLPLLDGHIATTVSNFLVPPPAQKSPQPATSLAPIERGLNQLNRQHQELVGQISKQNTALKRVEDQLVHVQTATDRNTLEQQELMQDLRSVVRRVTLFATIVLVLLILSVGTSVYLLLQLPHLSH